VLGLGDVRALFGDALRVAVVDLFSHYGEVVSPDEPGLTRSVGAHLGAMALVAPGLKGTIVLSAARGVLQRSKPGPSSDRDWLSELSNQLFGRVKTRLRRAGLEISSGGVPAIVDGRYLTATVTDVVRGPEQASFSAGGSEIIVAWIELEIFDDVRLDPPEEADSLVQEGDVILF
jgi:hypothetical protein